MNISLRLSLRLPTLATVCLAVVGCAQTPSNSTSASASSSTSVSSAREATADREAIHRALANPERLAGDAAEDAHRQASVVLEFLGPRPGLHVIDYFAGGGYYTELLSHIVGAQGRVIAYNNPAYYKYAQDAIAKRYAAERLANVVQLTATPEAAPFERESIDAVLFVHSLHDLYWQAKDGAWPRTNPGEALATLVRALKPGAVVVVVDHAARAGSDPAVSVDGLHRIDPAVVKRDLTAAGLVFDAESRALANPQDERTKPVFDPSVRRKTDQFIYRFRKP